MHLTTEQSLQPELGEQCLKHKVWILLGKHCATKGTKDWNQHPDWLVRALSQSRLEMDGPGLCWERTESGCLQDPLHRGRVRDRFCIVSHCKYVSSSTPSRAQWISKPADTRFPMENGIWHFPVTSAHPLLYSKSSLDYLHLL